MFLFCVLVSSDELAQRQQTLTPICCKLTSDSCLLASIPSQEITLQSTKRVISHISHSYSPMFIIQNSVGHLILKRHHSEFSTCHLMTEPLFVSYPAGVISR